MQSETRIEIFNSTNCIFVVVVTFITFLLPMKGISMGNYFNLLFPFASTTTVTTAIKFCAHNLSGSVENIAETLTKGHFSSPTQSPSSNYNHKFQLNCYVNYDFPSFHYTDY